MRLSTVGIILLTSMIATKYFVSLEALRAEDGSFKSGIEVDYTASINKLYKENFSAASNNLLASNSSIQIELGKDKIVTTSTKNNLSDNGIENNSSTFVRRNNQAYSEDEPLPMEESNSLVVYDFSNPDNNIISSNFEDIEDDIPLDNGNTIIKGLMLIMPRR